MTRRVLAAVALAVGALLVFAGCFLEVYRLDAPNAPGSGGFALTPWRVEFRTERATPPNAQPSPQWGYALVLAAALAAFAAVALLRSPRLAAAARFAAALSVGVVGATAWSAYTTVTTLVGGRDLSPKFTWVIGSGLWTLATACLVLLGGTLLAQEWPPRAPRPDGALVYQVDGNDDDTPPFGIPVPDPAHHAGAADHAGTADHSGASDHAGTADHAGGAERASGVDQAGAAEHATPSGSVEVTAPVEGSSGAAGEPPSRSVDRTGEERPPTGGNPSTVE